MIINTKAKIWIDLVAHIFHQVWIIFSARIELAWIDIDDIQNGLDIVDNFTLTDLELDFDTSGVEVDLSGSIM